MKLTKEEERDLIAMEGFLRRATQLDFPFMLKGSLLTRQYLPDLLTRKAQDIDWVYLPHVDDIVKAQPIFSDWARQVTEMEADDDVLFDSFAKNDFWRMIDYAMSEDFPTINTDLAYTLDGEKCEIDLRMDVSFNLDIDIAPVPLMYRPMRGEPFLVRQTCPLALQVAWKLHQTIVRPRRKDIYDLIYLLAHEDFNEHAVDNTLKALLKECYRDGIDPRDHLRMFINEPKNLKIDDPVYLSYYFTVELPSDDLLLDLFGQAMRRAGFEEEDIDAIDPALIRIKPVPAKLDPPKLEEIKEAEKVNNTVKQDTSSEGGLILAKLFSFFRR